jgi:hypothetical protein
VGPISLRSASVDGEPRARSAARDLELPAHHDLSRADLGQAALDEQARGVAFGLDLEQRLTTSPASTRHGCASDLRAHRRRDRARRPENRLARARLTGQNVETVAELDGDVVEDRQVANAQRTQHGHRRAPLRISLARSEAVR